MTRETKLRLLGGCILLLNLILIGNYHIQGLPVLLLTFGFAAGYEFLVVRRGGSKKIETATAADDQSFYEQAISEIRARRVIKAVWAKAFAEADGDQKRTMARYITLRVEQIKAGKRAKANQGEIPSKPSPHWWHWVLQLIGVFLLVKLIGPLPAVLAALCYAWLIRKQSTFVAMVGAGVVGLFLVFVASYLLPPDAKLKPESSALLSSKEARPDYIDWTQYEPVKPAPTHEASQKTVDPAQERLAAAPPPIAAVTPPAAKNQAEAHYAEIYAVHPDADRIAESPSFAQWLRGRPNYQFVMQKGTAGQVIAVFSEFKAQRTNQQPLDLTYDPNWKAPSRP